MATRQQHFQRIDVRYDEPEYPPPLDKYELQTSPALLEQALQSELKRAQDYHREHPYAELAFLESTAVKHLHKIANGFVTRVERDLCLRRLLYRSKDDVFPTKWMEEKLSPTLDRYPSLIRLLNHVHNLTRRFNNRRELFGEGLATLGQVRDFNRRNGIEVEEPSHGRGARGKTWPLAAFDVHKNFYEDTAKAAGCSDHLVRKMVQAIVRAGVYRVAHDNFDHAGRWRFLSDGYYTAAHEGAPITKRSFIVDRPEVVRALRELEIR